MIKSMTAYGRGEAEAQGLKWVVELRSVNHRFLELNLNLPRRLWALEDRLRKLLKGRIARGRVDVQLTWETLGEKPLTLRLDPALAGEARAVLQDLLTYCDQPEPLTLTHLLAFAEVIVSREGEAKEMDTEAAWEGVSQAAAQALEVLDEMRLAEGAALAADLEGHLNLIRREAGGIAARAADLPQQWRERVTSRLAELLQESPPVDESRLAQEVAIMADRRDVSEELTRLDSHLAQFHQTLKGPGPVGRKQEFLLQEMLREANTMGSKAGDLGVSQAVLEIKGALERLREQVQNVE
ncbi:MAG: YicC family protein [Deltaproteobacteria bacterium]|nr:YicC family protein [Deltaproteobacteria bacterium]